MFLIFEYAVSGTYSVTTGEISVYTDSPAVLSHEQVHKALWMVSLTKPFVVLAYFFVMGIGSYRWAETLYLFYIFTTGSNELTAYFLTGSGITQALISLFVFQNVILCWYLFRHTDLLEKNILKIKWGELFMIMVAGFSFAAL